MTPPHTVPTPPTNLRARKKAETRETIAESALKLFAERGFDKVTVDEIARAAGISRRTFFRYFPSKEDVVFAPQRARLAAFESMVGDPRPDETPYQTLRRGLLEMADLYTAQRAAVVGLQRIVDASPTLAAHERVIDRGWDEAVTAALRRQVSGVAAERQARLVAGALVGAVRATLRTWVEAEGRLDLGALGLEALSLLEHGLKEL